MRAAVVLEGGDAQWAARRVGAVEVAQFSPAAWLGLAAAAGGRGQDIAAYATGPALQGIVSKSSPPEQQGEVMGSLQSIGSLGVIVTPLLGTGILSAVSHLPPDDWRIGSSFFLCAAMQAVALVVAWHYFRSHRYAGVKA